MFLSHKTAYTGQPNITVLFCRMKPKRIYILVSSSLSHSFPKGEFLSTSTFLKSKFGVNILTVVINQSSSRGLATNFEKLKRHLVFKK